MRILGWGYAALVISLLGPFFILGAALGQFVGATYYGYQAGREKFIEMNNYFHETYRK